MEPDAEQWVQKQAVSFLRRIGIEANQTVLDFGCHHGNYTKPAAQIVGPDGKVYALDKDREVLTDLQNQVAESDLNNIEFLHVSEEDPIPLSISTVDMILLYDVVHRGYAPEPEQRARTLEEVHRVLKPDGRLSFYPTHLKKYGMTFRKQLREVRNAGFDLLGESKRKLVHDGRLVRGRIFTCSKKVAGRGSR
ncbi:MAG: class I SAM-dependent methyltransferase [Candidatus Brocadiia bacterium]